MAAHDDLDLMQLVDGELSAPRAREVEAEASLDDQRKLEALRQIGESVRTHLELAADDAEPRLDALWGNIERRITANGAAPEAAAAPSPARAASPRNKAADEGLWAGLRRWWNEHRGYVFTSAVTAGAVATLILLLRPPTEHTTVRVVEVPTTRRTTKPTPATVRASTRSTPPAVDYLDVTDGSGTVMTLDQDDDDDSAATVIWVTRDKMEDPI